VVDDVRHRLHRHPGARRDITQPGRHPNLRLTACCLSVPCPHRLRSLQRMSIVVENPVNVVKTLWGGFVARLGVARLIVDREFVAWSRKADVEPIWAVNLGTRGIKETVELLEYCNLPAGTELPDRRVDNGNPEPHGIKVWCLGNEMDGPWQIGHKTADEYARLAEETANAMRRVDPGLELVACGSSNAGMPTFGEWERVVLERTYDLVDHISLHAYYEPKHGDQASFLAVPEEM